jgi:pimeloyl-ACP methyl ester carboxylesterase
MEHKSGYVTVDGAQLYYERAGAGEPVVLLHTGNGDTGLWDGQFEELARDYSVIRYDVRGFGRSGYPPVPFLLARDLAGLLDHLEVTRAHVIGPSFGGRIATEFAVLYPERVASLLLAAPVLRDHVWSQEVTSLRMSDEKAFQDGDLDAATDFMLKGFVAGPRRTLDQMDPGLLAKIRVSQAIAYNRRRATMDEAGGQEPDEEELSPPAGERLSSISAPTLVLIGGMDQPDCIMLGARIAGSVPGARSRWLPDIGHMITAERPAEFLGIAREFLGSVPRL